MACSTLVLCTRNQQYSTSILEPYWVAPIKTNSIICTFQTVQYSVFTIMEYYKELEVKSTTEILEAMSHSTHFHSQRAEL